MSRELEYFDALKQITHYQTLRELRNNSERAYGLTYEEALEMSYENVIGEAKQAVKGKRRPTAKE